MAHDYYLLPGGEDTVFQNEVNLLRAHNNDVREYAINNAQIASMHKLELGVNTIWSRNSRRDFIKIVEEFRPDLVHFHNIFPLLSPSVYYACESAQVPVVQTLHNYRMLCPSALLHRSNQPCQECLGRIFAWPGILHACYRNSAIATTGVAVMSLFHRMIGTWTRRVTSYIALTEFMRQKYVDGGLPAHKIWVKPNFVNPDPGIQHRGSAFALYIGRLSAEKGLKTLLDAWQSIGNIPLILAGDGPERAYVENAIQEYDLKDVMLKGQITKEGVISLLREARFLIIPSVSYEGFPLVILEAFACGVPVIAFELGAMAEIIQDGVTGLLVTPGDPAALGEKVRWAWSHPVEIARMGVSARRAYEEKYSAGNNYEILMNIYRQAIDDCSS